MVVWAIAAARYRASRSFLGPSQMALVEKLEGGHNGGRCQRRVGTRQRVNGVDLPTRFAGTGAAHLYGRQVRRHAALVVRTSEVVGRS